MNVMKKHNNNKSMIVLMCIAVLSVGGMASGDLLINCVYDGYVFMGGAMGIRTEKPYLLPGNPFSAPVHAGPQGLMQTWGFAFLKFDGDALPAAPVEKAYLKLDVIGVQDGQTWPVEGTTTLAAYQVTADVQTLTGPTAEQFRDESIVGLTDAPAAQVSISGPGFVWLNITDIVNGWIGSGDNFGLVLASKDDLIARLHSTASTDGAAPVIVPEPATLAMLGLGAAGLLSRRKGR